MGFHSFSSGRLVLLCSGTVDTEIPLDFIFRFRSSKHPLTLLVEMHRAIVLVRFLKKNRISIIY